MANTTSAKKATRKIARRTVINKSRRTQMRGSVRIVEEAIKSGDRDAALKAMARAEPELMQAAQRNIIHKNNASRKVSRLAHQIAKLAKRTNRKGHSSKSPAVPGFLFCHRRLRCTKFLLIRVLLVLCKEADPRIS